ncbi:MAG: serpin family protein [Verrucomicrobiota bacterium]
MLATEPTATAASAINALGIDLLLKSGPPDVNALLSPYSIQSALVMAYTGAAGDTRSEMTKVLHYSKDDAEIQRSFAALKKSLAEVAQKSTRDAEQMQKWGGKIDPITLTMANRLFGQTGYAFREPFLKLVKDDYDAQLELLDFVKDAADATKHINSWVEEQTRERIRDLIPTGRLTDLTRLVLVNAIYLKTPWACEFYESNTKGQPFHLSANNLISVPTMMSTRTVGYARRDGCTVLTIPYWGSELQFLILLPEQPEGLRALEKNLTAKQLAGGARLGLQMVILYLPKFKLEPPLMSLGLELQALGMKSAFDQPRGTANFDRIAPRRASDYLYISEVFHKTFLKLDENGTEAAAATAFTAILGSQMGERPKPIEVRVDHPFLFAIQHRTSGACLFLGRVCDPR